MFGRKKKGPEKLTIQEFLKLKEQRKKRIFHFQPYPWPVTAALLIPLVVLALLLFTYFSHIRGVLG
jgi:hypothetical protein